VSKIISEPMLHSCLCRLKIVARFVPNIPQAQKSFWMHKVELLGDGGHVESHFSPF
jgi:hypothetical protein